MTYLREFTDIIQKAVTINTSKSRTGGRGAGVIVYTDGVMSEINISSSLITKFYRMGNKKEYCPKRMYLVHITNELKEDVSTSEMNRRYFKTAILGSCEDGSIVNDLPRHAKTKSKLTDQKRLDTHIDTWSMKKEFHGIISNKTGEQRNTNLVQKVRWEDEQFEGTDIWLYTTANIISPLRVDNDLSYDMAIIEVETTESLYYSFNGNGWANIHERDHFKIIFNSIAFNIPACAYIVFEYAKNMNYRIFPINVNPEQENIHKFNEVRTRIAEVKQTINAFLADLLYHEETGWKTEPSINNCRGCNHIYCEFYGKSMEY